MTVIGKLSLENQKDTTRLTLLSHLSSYSDFENNVKSSNFDIFRENFIRFFETI